ncbi:MAG: hypothetical protein ACI9G9_001121 [Psychromonas sp.]|jgi:hypothetical protein
MIFRRSMLLFCLSVLVISQGCNKDKLEPVVTSSDCEDAITYDAQVATIINNNCSTSGCHDSSNSGGYTLMTFEQVSNNADIILRAMKHEDGVVPMPLGQDQLDEGKINDVSCWILQGKNEN